MVTQLLFVLWGDDAVKHGVLKVVSNSALRPLKPKSGCVWAHSGCVYVLIVETLDKHGALKVVFQYCFKISQPTKWLRVPT